MGANLTVQDLFKLILFLLGIGVGAYLIMALNKINKILDNIKNLMDNNSEELDITIKQLPGISKNINDITEETNNTLRRVSPDIEALIHNSGKISGSVTSITESVDSISTGIVDTVGIFRGNKSNFTDYLAIAKEVFEILKNLINKKQKPFK